MPDAPTVAATLPDPTVALERVYRRIAPSMEFLPIYNDALQVQAVGFAPWQQHWLGVLVTPWFINLVLMPREPAAWTRLPVGGKRSYAFPAGAYEFVGAHDHTLGDYQTCALFSPALEFQDHATARLVAELARDALLDAAHGRDGSAGAAAGGLATAPHPLAPAADAPTPVAPELATRLAQPMSKRDLLRGRFLRADAP